MDTKLTFNPKLPITQIIVSDSNVRKANAREGLEELAKNIAEIGLKQPIVVFKKGDQYHLIIGQRRFLACKDILGWKTIPALITPIENDTDVAIISFSENLHRLDLEYKDKMTVATYLLSTLGSRKKVAQALGVSEQSVRNYLGYAGLPEEMKKMDIPPTTALKIWGKIPDEKKAIEIAKLVKGTANAKRRETLIDTQAEHLEYSTEQVKKHVKDMEYHRLTIYLTPKVSEALKSASESYNSSREDIALNALTEWLKGKRFIK
ncbi:MAG: ParB/RepB/Spo0J family partition protein [Planctomycetota bacterium]|nr:ParB/RepB/Spo0J family partition protein [Planctomycetota bacterium]